MTFLWW